MGAAQSSVSYNRVPNAILAFGSTKDNGSDTLRSIIATLHDVSSQVDTMMQEGSNFLEFLVVAAPYAAYVAKFFSVVNDLITETEALNRALNDLELRIYSTLLDGKLSALKNHLSTIQDNDTPVEQKKMELALAIAHFTEILPIFTREDSILNLKYYIGAQLFVPFCGLFKVITVIANNMPTYHNPVLQSLTEAYQNTLKSFKHRCIRGRLASIHFYDEVQTRSGRGPNLQYYEGDLQRFPDYFGTAAEKEKFQPPKHRSALYYIKYFTFKFFLLPILEDPWDPREDTEITFGTVTMERNEEPEWKVPDTLTDHWLHITPLRRKTIHVYREKVLKVMEEFFDSV